MAARRSPQRGSAGGANASITTADIVGTYAYRFGGYVMLQVRPWWLTGIGKLKIAAPQENIAKVTGAHRSSIMPIEAQDSPVTPATWTLDGTIEIHKDGTGTATIVFKSVSKRIGKRTRRLRGEFNVVVPGTDRLWMMSQQTWLLGNDTYTASQELVQVEAVRVPY